MDHNFAVNGVKETVWKYKKIFFIDKKKTVVLLENKLTEYVRQEYICTIYMRRIFSPGF